MKNYADREMNDLNRNIQAAQLRVNDIFAAIGRTYYNENQETPQGAYIQMFSDLRATQEQIKQMETRIKFLNGIVVCTKCKSDNSVHSAFCSVCGTRLPHTFSSDNANRCRNCGSVINPGQMFCGSCGVKVENGADIQQSVNRPQPDFSSSAQTIAQPQHQENPEMPQDMRTEQAIQHEAAVPTEPVPEAVMNSGQDAVMQSAAETAADTEQVMQPFSEQSEKPAEEQEAIHEPSEQKRVCPNCKTPVVAEDALFCAECGTRL